jgi:hypothetical protein
MEKLLNKVFLFTFVCFGSSLYAEHDWRILRLQLSNRLILSDGLEALYRDGSMFYSIRDICAAIGCTAVPRKNGKIRGLNSFNKSFVIDTKNSDDVVAVEGLFYLQSNLIEDNLEIKLRHFPLRSLIVIETKKTLPIVAKNKRKTAWKMRDSQGQDESKKRSDIVRNLNGVHLADLNLALQGKPGQTSAGLDGIVVNEGLYGRFISNFTLHKAQQEIRSVYRYLFDQSVSSELYPKQISVGHIYADIPEELGTFRGEWGIKIDNYEMNQSQFSGSHSFQGFVGVGWEIEVYRNGIKEAYVSSDANGSFKTQEILLKPGRNDFRLVKIGPQGQLLQQNIVIKTLGDQNKKFLYRMQTVTGIDDSVATIGLSTAINNNLSLGLEALRIDRAQQINQFMIPSLVAELGRMSLYHRGIINQDSNNLLKHRMSYDLNDLRLFAEHNKNNRFEGGPIGKIGYQYATNFGAEFFVDSHFLSRVVFGVDQTRRTDEQVQRSYFMKGASAIGNLHFSEQLKLTESQIEQNEFSISLYQPYLTLRLAHILNRNSSNLALLELSKNIQKWNARIYYSQKYDDRIYKVSLSRIFDEMRLGAQVSYGHGEPSFVLSASTSIGLSASGKLMHSAKSLTQEHIVEVRSYVDSNENGDQDSDEPYVDIKYLLDGRKISKSKLMVGSHTIAISAHRETHILSVDKRTIEDPSLSVAGSEDIMITAVPGGSQKVVFRLIRRYDIDGYLLKKSGQNCDIGVSHQNLVLKNMNSSRQIKTFYDGYFIFEKIPKGDYSLYSGDTGAASKPLLTIAVGAKQTTDYYFELCSE